MTDPDPQPIKRELFIWWTTNVEAITLIGDQAPMQLPQYVREQYHHRRGFCSGAGGPKALWVDAKFGEREISHWPDTRIARMLRDDTSQGIVFSDADLKRFKGVPGLVTDFKLRIMVI
jgi:hypothetical protein